MTDYTIMTDTEINRRLAEAMGWPFISWEPFSPATDSNHLRLYVLLEIERRGLVLAFCNTLQDLVVRRFADDPSTEGVMGSLLANPWEFSVLKQEPRVPALAALRVLEETTWH